MKLLKILISFFSLVMNQRGEVGGEPAVAEEAPTGQEEATNEFFDDKVYDDDGNELKTEEEKKEAKTEEKPKGEVKEGEDKDKVEEKPINPIGFENTFFDKNEKGETAFNAENALNFFSPKEKGQLDFSYLAPQFQAPTEKPAEEDKRTAAQKYWEGEQKYRTELSTNLNTGLDAYKKAREAGHGEAEAFAYGQQQSSEYMNKHIGEREIERNIKREEELEQRTANSEASNTVKNMARSNEMVLINHLGGQENYNAMFFGYKDDKGVAQPGLGTNVVYKLFELANPQARKIKDGQTYGVEVNKFWNNYIGDSDTGMNNLQFVWDIVRSQMQRKFMPDIIKQVRGVKEKEMNHKELNRGKGPVVAGGQPRIKEQGGSGLNRYFNGVKDTV